MHHLRYAVQGSLALLVISASTIVHTLIIFVLAILKFAAPAGPPRSAVTRWLAGVGETWVSVNKFVLWFYRSMEWDIRLPAGLDHGGRYLLFCNHLSWVDTMVLQFSLNRHAPFMRFLMKHNLIYVPFLGFCWWALDMVFLKRYSERQLENNPDLGARNLENAALACKKLKHIPVTMMVFPEGTRFSDTKHRQQQSPYRHLLRPRYGGIGQMLYSFEDTMRTVIDVTIHYPGAIPTFWQFISGQVGKISFHARLISIAPELRGANVQEYDAARARLATWMDKIWQEKDAQLDRMDGPIGLVKADRMADTQARQQ